MDCLGNNDKRKVCTHAVQIQPLWSWLHMTRQQLYNPPNIINSWLIKSKCKCIYIQMQNLSLWRVVWLQLHFMFFHFLMNWIIILWNFSHTRNLLKNCAKEEVIDAHMGCSAIYSVIPETSFSYMKLFVSPVSEGSLVTMFTL